MANIKSAIKRARLATIRTLRNRSVKSRVRTATRRFEESLAEKAAGAAEDLREAISQIDRAVKKGILHRNTAARRKSRLMKMFAGKQASDRN